MPIVSGHYFYYSRKDHYVFHLNLLFYILNFYQSSHTVTCQCYGRNCVLSLPFCSWLLHHICVLPFSTCTVCCSVWGEGQNHMSGSMSFFWGGGVLSAVHWGGHCNWYSKCALFCWRLHCHFFSFCCLDRCFRDGLEFCCDLTHLVWFTWWRDEWWRLGAIGLVCWGFWTL